MPQEKFKVFTSWGLFVPILTATFAISIVLCILYSVPHAAVIVGSILIPFIPCVLGLVMLKLYFVEVNGENISVRTKLGRRFNFKVSEIKKVTYDTSQSGDCTQYEIITIQTTTEKFDVEQTMNGFQEMAIYLLENLAKGEISNEAISVSCKRKLNKYKNDKKYRHDFGEDEE